MTTPLFQISKRARKGIINFDRAGISTVCNFTKSINGNICFPLLRLVTCVDKSSPSKWEYLLKVSPVPSVCLLP